MEWSASLTGVGSPTIDLTGIREQTVQNLCQREEDTQLVRARVVSEEEHRPAPANITSGRISFHDAYAERRRREGVI